MMRYRRFFRKGSGGTSLAGIAVMLIVLLIVTVLLIICNMRMMESDMQTAADSLADGVAVFMANEGGDFDEACEKAEEIRQLLQSQTGISLDSVALDREALDNNEAKVTVMTTGSVDMSSMGVPAYSYVFTKSAVTKFSRRSDMIRLYGADAEIDYVQWAIDIANDDTHGYCLHDVYQGQGHPDYDCSYLVSSALRECGYISGSFSTGSEYGVLVGAGFTCMPYNESQLKSGDILYRPATTLPDGTHLSAHTEIYVGNGWIVGAHQSEDASRDYLYGAPGDQTGQEISVSLNSGKFWTRMFRLARVNETHEEEDKNA